MVHARRDDPVRARERDRGDVAHGSRRGDRRVERVEQAPELRPRGPERPHLLGIGVERRDQRAAGVAQRRPAEAGHERLVEVQEVEVLGAEQDVDVGDEVRRRGDELQGAALLDRVCRAGEEEARVRLVGQEHRLPLPGEDRLHPALCLVDREAVGGRGDDGHAMPRGRQAVSERAHLVVDGRLRGPEERREDAELERHALHATPHGPRRTRAGAARASRPRRPFGDRSVECQPWQTALAPGPSPLMNSSVMRRHSSSGCCTGGDFMK